jgi:DNA-binding PadR family transcriptional regulator
LTASGGELGRVWQLPKAVVYRAIGRLADAELLAPEVTEPGLGPQRTVYAATPRGHEAAGRWLRTPVEHVREIRSQLLLKLALLDRADQDPSDLPRRSRRARRGAPGSTRPCWPGGARPRSRRSTSSTGSRPPGHG